jgi:hypothetical protein
MKKIILSLLVLLPGLSVLAQDHSDRYQQPPEPVRQSFQRQYPQAENPQWNQQYGQWNAHFNDKGPESRGEMIAHYDHEGTNIDSHIRYDQHDVPAPVNQWAHSRYRHGHYEYTRIERPGDDGFFEVKINLGGKTHINYVDEYGHERTYDNHH